MGMATLKLFNCVKNPILIKNARQLCTTVRKFNLETKEDLGKCTPEHDQTIYQGILSAQIKLVKGFSLTTSFISIACQPVLMMNMHQANTNLAVMAGAGAFLSIFTFATPLLIHHISKKYVTELNYNKLEDSYTAITYSLFLRKKEIKFKIKDVHVPSIPGMFTTFQAKDYLCLLTQTNLKILDITAKSWDMTNRLIFGGTTRQIPLPVMKIRRVRKYIIP